MSSAALFRCLQRGGSVLLQAKVNPNMVLSGLAKGPGQVKMYRLTPMSSGALDYFRARRGPFTPAEKQGSHMIFASTHWKIERVLAVSMIGIMPAALFVQGPVMDFVLTTTVFMHAFWAFDHVLSDYVQKFFPPVHILWYIISIIAFAGLMHFNYNDVGVTKAIAMLWNINRS